MIPQYFKNLLVLFNLFLLAELGTTGEVQGSASPVEDAGPGRKFETLEVTVKDGVQTIKLNRPKKYNAITWEVRKFIDCSLYFLRD
jgi:hypothetical protein